MLDCWSQRLKSEWGESELLQEGVRAGQEKRKAGRDIDSQPAFDVQVSVSSFSLERCHVDREAILHIASQHAFVGFVDLLNRNDFDI